MAQPMGFFTDTTICIGCKACEVACKEWNQLPATNGGRNTLSGDSYDCPTGAIIRTEFDTVVIQSDVCNGCRDCIAACPFGVIDINPVSGTAQKCTLCYDRLRGGMQPACSQACPTTSIMFGPIAELRNKAEARVAQLQTAGETGAYLYGADEQMLGGLNSFYLLVDKPAVYGLPAAPKMPSRNLKPSALWSAIGAAVIGLMGVISFRNRGRGDA